MAQTRERRNSEDNGLTSVAEVRDLAARRRAVILAHHYQVDEVLEAADHTGDSYALACLAARSTAEVILLAGVRFMAESAAILAPTKRVLHPVPGAGCPLADTITPQDVRRLREENPGVPVVSYVNTTAAVKALSDCCCTSANAVAVVRALGAPRVILIPDQNLAHWVSLRTGVEIIPWRGFCHVHHRVRVADVETARREMPGAVFVAHPECRPEVVALADEVASTSGIFKYVAASSAAHFIIGTEEGVLGRLRRENPAKTFRTPVAGMICPNMKMITLEDVRDALENMEPVVRVEETVAGGARRALERMVAVTG